jgi:hypothetical protein
LTFMDESINQRLKYLLFTLQQQQKKSLTIKYDYINRYIVFSNMIYNYLILFPCNLNNMNKMIICYYKY